LYQYAFLLNAPNAKKTWFEIIRRFAFMKAKRRRFAFI